LFIAFLLTHIKKQDIAFRAKGITVYHLHGRDLLDLSIYMPKSNNEQSAIAAVLSDMDTEIEALTAKLDKAKSIKQGMMQELLTGRIRIGMPGINSHKGTKAQR
jgi:type I restriction enzyme S subunit